MNYHPPRKVFRLPNRTVVPLGTSPFLLTLDWLSTTWFRFNITFIWLLLVSTVSVFPFPMTGKLSIFLVSPIATIVFYYLIYLLRVLLAFDEKRKMWVGYFELAYFRLFSRFVVQQIELDLPVWH